VQAKSKTDKSAKRSVIAFCGNVYFYILHLCSNFMLCQKWWPGCAWSCSQPFRRPSQHRLQRCHSVSDGVHTWLTVCYEWRRVRMWMRRLCSISMNATQYIPTPPMSGLLVVAPEVRPWWYVLRSAHPLTRSHKGC